MLYMYVIYTFLSRFRPHGGRQLGVTRFLWKGAGLPSLVLLCTILWLVCLLGINIAAAALPSGWTDVDSLTETRWQQLGQDILAGGPTTSVTDTIRSGLAAFYRVEFVR
jgi:hypothetical protein